LDIGREKVNAVSNSDHTIVGLEITDQLPGFWGVSALCMCGAHHYWLVTSDEMDIAIELLGSMRKMRKELQDNVPDSISTFRVSKEGS